VCETKTCDEHYSCRTGVCCNNLCAACTKVDETSCTTCNQVANGDDETWSCGADGACSLSIEEKGLGGGSIAAIVIFCTAIVSAVAILIFCCCCKGNAQKSIDNHEANQIAYDANIPGQ
jgi:hypothetical protein